MMILAFDTFYKERNAKTVCIAFEEWTSTTTAIYSETISNVEEYEPGAFYKRELPCIASLIKKIVLQDIEAIIIDGFVVLDDNDKPGLGSYLFEMLEKKIPRSLVWLKQISPALKKIKGHYTGEKVNGRFTLLLLAQI